jgi:hypothetical protein
MELPELAERAVVALHMHFHAGLTKPGFEECRKDLCGEWHTWSAEHDERLKMCLVALITVKAAISKSPKDVDFPFTIAKIIDNCLEACAEDVRRFSTNNKEVT